MRPVKNTIDEEKYTIKYSYDPDYYARMQMAAQASRQNAWRSTTSYNIWWDNSSSTDAVPYTLGSRRSYPYGM